MTSAQIQELLNKGVTAARAGKLLSARMQLEQVTEHKPSDAAGWIWLAWVAESPEAAGKHLKRALECLPNNPVALSGLAWVRALVEYAPAADGTVEWKIPSDVPSVVPPTPPPAPAAKAVVPQPTAPAAAPELEDWDAPAPVTSAPAGRDIKPAKLPAVGPAAEEMPTSTWYTPTHVYSRPTPPPEEPAPPAPAVPLASEGTGFTEIEPSPLPSSPLATKGPVEFESDFPTQMSQPPVSATDPAFAPTAFGETTSPPSAASPSVEKSWMSGWQDPLTYAAEAAKSTSSSAFVEVKAPTPAATSPPPMINEADFEDNEPTPVEGPGPISAIAQEPPTEETPSAEPELEMDWATQPVAASNKDEAGLEDLLPLAGGPLAEPSASGPYAPGEVAAPFGTGFETMPSFPPPAKEPIDYDSVSLDFPTQPTSALAPAKAKAVDDWEPKTPVVPSLGLQELGLPPVQPPVAELPPGFTEPAPLPAFARDQVPAKAGEGPSAYARSQPSLPPPPYPLPGVEPLGAPSVAPAPFFDDEPGATGIDRLEEAREMPALDVPGELFDAPTAEPEPDRRTVLVVDDSPTVCKIVSMTLEKRGHRVISALNGEAAMALIGQRRPDLILLDITMPGMDGYKLCKLIKGYPDTRNIPVVMLSGKDGFFDKVRGRLVGCAEYITKPFDPEVLVQKSEMYLQAAGARR